MPPALTLIALGLTAWVFELGAVLQGQAVVRDWSSVWVGLDAQEVAAWYESLAAALFCEIPTAVLLAAIATQSAKRKRPRGRLRRYRGYLCTYTVAKYTQ